jgi:hypothetical protein
MATGDLTQAAASKLGVTLTGDYGHDSDAIMHALSGASEAMKEAFTATRYAPAGVSAQAYADANFSGHQQVTNVIAGDNSHVALSDPSVAWAGDYWSGVNAEHAKTATELTRLLSDAFSGKPTVDGADTVRSSDATNPNASRLTFGKFDPNGLGPAADTNPATQPNSTFPALALGTGPVPVTPGTPPETTPGTPPATGGTPIDKLIDLVAAQYAGSGGMGSGSIVALPTGVADGGGADTSSGSNVGKVLIVGGIVAGLAYWYYKKHKAA